jgi:hypothetical protein
MILNLIGKKPIDPGKIRRGKLSTMNAFIWENGTRSRNPYRNSGQGQEVKY